MSPDVHRIALELQKAIGRRVDVGYIQLNFNEGKVQSIETHAKDKVSPIALVDNPGIARAK